MKIIGKHDTSITDCFRKTDWRWLAATFKMYRQQKEMFNNKVHTCVNRIISIFQSHICSIVRGKAKAKVEFGAKLGARIVDGFTYMDHISWDTYNECKDLTLQIAQYKSRWEVLPEEVQADKLYPNRQNCKILKELGIKCYCKPLGRPRKIIDKEWQKEELRAIGERNEIEATFGTSKRVYHANNIRAKLEDTARSWIASCFFAKNLMKFLRGLFALFIQIGQFLRLYRRKNVHFSRRIVSVA